jgi:hypothetical protein
MALGNLPLVAGGRPAEVRSSPPRLEGSLLTRGRSLRVASVHASISVQLLPVLRAAFPARREATC